MPSALDAFALAGAVPNSYPGGFCSTRKLLADEFARLGCQVKVLDRYLLVTKGSQEICFLETESSNTSLIGWRVLKNKDSAREFFRQAGITIAEGKLFQAQQRAAAEKYALSLKKVVVKPADGRKGIGTTVGVTNKGDFLKAWHNALAVSRKGILIEEQFTDGVEARYLVVGNKCVAVVKRIPPHVIGNGLDSIDILINKKNALRAQNPHLKSRLIKLTQHRVSLLNKQGYKPDSVPGRGKAVLLDSKASFSSGGDSWDITDQVHPLFKQIAERVSLVVPGLDIVGVDIIAKDHTGPPDASNYIVVEANTRPALGCHLFPVYGRPINVARLIAEYSLSRMTD